MLILRDIPNRYAIIGSLLSFAGLIYVMGQGNPWGLLHAGGQWGDLLMIIAVFFYAFTGSF